MKNKSETNKYSNQNFRISAKKKKEEEASFFSSIGNILNRSGIVTGFMRECEQK